MSPRSRERARLVNDATLIARSQIAYPETRAALARKRREGALSEAAFTMAKPTFDADWPRYFAVEVTASLCRQVQPDEPEADLPAHANCRNWLPELPYTQVISIPN